MANQKPNFKPYGNKKSGVQKPKEPSPSSKVDSRTHHDTLKGNKGNGGGRK